MGGRGPGDVAGIIVGPTLPQDLPTVATARQPGRAQTGRAQIGVIVKRFAGQARWRGTRAIEQGDPARLAEFIVAQFDTRPQCQIYLSTRERGSVQNMLFLPEASKARSTYSS